MNVLMKAAQRRIDLNLGLQIWNWALPRRRAKQGDSSLTFVTVQLLLLCVWAGDSKMAQRIWSEYRQMGSEAKPGIFGTLLSVFALNGDEATPGRPLSSKFTAQMLASALTAYAHAGENEAALELLDKVESSAPKGTVDIKAYTALIDGFVRKGDFDTALQLVDRVKTRGLALDADVWMTILSPCRHFKRLDIALHAFDQCKQLEERAAAYVLMADVYKQCGDFEAASALHQERLKGGLNKERGAVTLLINGATHTFNVGTIPLELEHASGETGRMVNMALLSWYGNIIYKMHA